MSGLKYILNYFNVIFSSMVVENHLAIETMFLGKLWNPASTLTFLIKITILILERVYY